MAKFAERGKRLVAPLADVLVKAGIGPDFLTYAGIFFAVLCGVAYGTGRFRVGALLLALSGLSDSLDGEVARRSMKKTRFGALLDSLSDRFVEFFIFFGLMAFFRNNVIALGLLYLCLFLSIMVSYLRARGEGLGVTVTAGPMDRTGRFIFLFVASLVDGKAFLPLMALFMALTLLTVVRRFVQLYNSFRRP